MKKLLHYKLHLVAILVLIWALFYIGIDDMTDTGKHGYVVDLFGQMGALIIFKGFAFFF